MPDPTDFNPFPGLRPFESFESHLFFGREEQVADLIKRLGRTRFLAVVGSSGSGKSSLVRAGLLPALLGGELSRAGSDWRIAVFRPGSDPIGNLNRALDGDIDPAKEDIALHLREAVLRKSSFGLIEASFQLGMPDSENLLIVADQFEEIFRFARLRDPAAAEDASAFVKLLLDSAAQPARSVYVVLTMRSDFIGDCASFEDLPEALNRSQYLVPRMTRDQRRSAIEGPIAVGGATISPMLLQQILNEVGSNPDQLPLMQHALMRTWEHWKIRTGGAGPIEVEDYVAVGALANALSDHVEEAYASLADERSRGLAEKIFKCLTEVGSDNRERRRPTTLSEICRVTGATHQELVPVINEFRAANRSFLTPSAEKELDEDTVIDISHESLIRNWSRLERWCRDEALAAEMYGRLSDAARRHEMKTGSLWSGPELSLALQWRDRNQPTRAWSERYDENFDRTIAFLERSLQVRDEERHAEAQRREAKRRAASRTAAISFAVALLLAFLTVYAFRQTRTTAILSRQLSASSATLLSKKPGQEYEAMTAAIQSVPDDFLVGEPRAPVLNALIGALSAARFSLPLIHPLDIRGGVFSPNGKYVATICEDGSLHLWEVATGLRLSSWQRKHVSSGHWPAAPVFSPDSNFAVFTDSSNKVVVLDTATGRISHTLDAGPQTDFSGFLPAGALAQRDVLLTVSSQGEGALWDSGSWQRIREFRSPAYNEAALVGEHYATVSPRKGLVLIWGRKGDAHVLSLANGEEVGELPFQPRRILDAEISPSASRILILGGDGATSLFDISGLPRRKPLELKRIESCGNPRFSNRDDFLCIHRQSIRLFSGALRERSIPRETPDPGTPDLISASFSQDSRYIVSASRDETARVWSASSGALVRTLTGHTDAVESTVFSDDGEKVLSVSLDNQARIWRWRGYSFVRPVVLGGDTAEPPPVQAVAVSKDGQEVYVGHQSGGIEIFRSSDASRSSAFQLPPACMDAVRAPGIDSIKLLPGTGSMLTVSGGRICLLNPGTKPKYALSLSGSPLRHAILSPDGARLLTIQEHAATLWDAQTGVTIAAVGEGSLLDGVFVPNEALFTVSPDNWSEWDPRTGHLRRVRDKFSQDDQPGSARLSPNGRYMVTNDPRHGLRMWALGENVRLYKQASGFWGPQTSFFFSPDETRVAGIRGHNAQLWSFSGQDPVVSLTFHTADVRGIVFSPVMPSLILTLGADNLAWLWSHDGTGISELRGHSGSVETATFFPDGKRAVTGSADGTARIFPTDLNGFAIESACGICDLLRARPDTQNIAECRRFTPSVCKLP